MTTFYYWPPNADGVWSDPTNWSLSQSTYTNPDKEFPTSGDNVIDGGNFVSGGSANDLTGGFDSLGADITDVNGVIPVSDGVGIEKGGVWTNTSSLDDEGGISVNAGSQLVDDGSDTIGQTNTLAFIYVTGAGASYSATGTVTDDGLINTYGGSITLGSVIGTGYVSIGIDGLGGSTAQIGAVSIKGLSVGSSSSLTAAAVTAGNFQVLGTATVSSLDLTGLATYQYLTVGSSGSLTDSGGLTFGNGTATVTDDGTFTLDGSNLVLGGVAGSSVAFSVGGTFDYAGSLAIGTAGDGEFLVSTSYTINNSLTLGSASTGYGGIEATGTSGDLTVAGSLTVGAAGGGGAQADLGGTLTVQSLIVDTAATGAHDYYDVLANGTSSLFDVIGDATIGAVGDANAEVESGATFEVGGTAVLGAALGASGRLMVTDGLWQSEGTFEVGLLGAGKVEVNADFAAAALDAAAVEVNNGSVSVYGTNATLDSVGNLDVGAGGAAGQATLLIESGATATATAMAIATQSTSVTLPDSVTVDGAGSTLTISNSVTLDSAVPTATNGNGDPDGTDGVWKYTTSGIGQIEVGGGGYMSIGQTFTLQDPSPNLDLTIDSGGGVEVGGSGGLTADTLQVDAKGLVIGHADIRGTRTGKIQVADTTTAPTWSLNIVNSGTITASNGTLLLEGNLSGGGQVLVGQNSTLEIGGTVADNVTVMFLPGGGQELIIDDPIDFNGTIDSENFEPGDEIDLPNVPYIDPGSSNTNPDGASFDFETGEDQQTYVLQVVENEQTYNIPISEDDDTFSGSFTLSDDGHGGTLITDTDDAETGYSVTAAADGPESKPYLGIVQIEVSFSPDANGNDTAAATGFYIAQNFILTNAHVVDHEDITGVLTEGKTGGPVPATWWKRDPNYPQFDLNNLHVPTSFDFTANDLAILYVPTGSPSYIQPQANFAGGEVDETGYTGEPQQRLGADQISAHGTVSLITSGVFGKDKALDLGEGSSGSPFYTDIAGQIKAVGVNAEGPSPSTGPGGAGVQLTDADLAAIAIWESQAPKPFYQGPRKDVNIVSAVASQGDDVAGQTVQFFLTTSENVTVTGAGATLSLNDGGIAIYDAAESTGTELVFDYTVGTGDQTANLEVPQVISGQTVQGPGGTSIDFSVLADLPTGLSINAPLVVTSVASSQSAEVETGQSIQLTLTLSDAVTVNTAGGAPTLTLNDGATATYDAAASNPSPGKLVFDYTVGSGDETANLEVTSVDLPTGTTIQDAAGYNANFTAAINAPTGLQVGPVYITAITPSLTIDLTTGQTLQLTLALSQGVTVNTSGGFPTLSLSDGATATYDAAASTPSTGTLVFDDTIGASDYTTDLQILSYNPNGATVTDTHGVTADLSAATQADLALDVNAATAISLTVSPATGEAESGQTVTLTLTMSEAVTVNLTGGSPTISLNDGATATYDAAASNPSDGTLVFAYTVGATDETPSLQISQVNLNGATIDDANGNAADLSAAANFTTTLQVGPAFVASLTPSLTGEIFTGQTDHLTLAMSQGVTLDTASGSPTLNLNDGATATYDSAASDPSTGTLVFDYTPGASDYTTDLTVLGYNPNGATVTDANGVNADFSSVAQYDLQLDVNAAIVTDVTSSPSSGEADSGIQVTVTLTMSGAVTVNTTNGAPTLSLSTGATATYDSAASDPSAGTLVFDDTVGAADETPDLQIIQVNLNGATIDDTNGNAADLSAASSFDTGLQIGPVYVDQVTPSLSGDITTGQTLQLTVSLSADVTVDATNGSPTLSLSDGATATYDTADSAPSAGTLVFDYTVKAGDYAAPLSVVGLIDNDATITDANGVSPDFSGLAQSYLGLDVNAATVSSVTSSPSSGEAMSGQQVLLTLTMSEPVTVNLTGGLPTLYLSDGGIATYDSAASNRAADTLVFSYTVGATDQDPSLQIAQVNLNGATIDDANGNAADLSAAPTIATNLQIGSEVPCFLNGTRIATPRGEVPVEQLSVGDEVMTLRGEVRPVVWIGVGKALATRGRRSAATPVIVRKGALADNLPHRDLRITKGHSLYIDDVLIPVEFLVNHRSILWDDHAREVSVYHIELETHDILLANGAPAESYRDDGNRWLFQNANSGWNLPPQEPCAPVLTGGPVVDAVWRRLLDRCGPRPGMPLTEDPDLHLFIDGQRVDGRAQAGGIHVFRLAERPGCVRIVSRAGAPDDLGIARDPRLLGVAVRQIRLWRGAELRLIEAPDPSLDEGFHLFEADNGFRWTDGDALLPAARFDGINGAFDLELHIGGATQYPLLDEPLRAAAA